MWTQSSKQSDESVRLIFELGLDKIEDRVAAAMAYGEKHNVDMSWLPHVFFKSSITIKENRPVNCVAPYPLGDFQCKLQQGGGVAGVPDTGAK